MLLYIQNIIYVYFRPHGKESTELQITQNNVKERKSLTRNWGDLRWKSTHKHTETYSKYFDGQDIFLNQKRVNVCEHTAKMALMTPSLSCFHIN